jgi:transcription elongation factor Elf1
MAVKTQKLPKEVLKFADCKFFIEKNCTKSTDECLFRHFQKAKDNEKACNAWKNGYTCRNLTCPYRHTAPDKKPKQKSASVEPAPIVTDAPKPVPHNSDERIVYFWDIENCAVPKGASAFEIVTRIRESVGKGKKETTFCCFTDVSSLAKETLNSLDYGHVKLVHVPDRKPGAADKKILLELNQFERDCKPPATVVLISGDIDFIQHLIVLKGLGYNVVVIHNRQAKPELKTIATKAYQWESFAKMNTNDKPSDSPNNSNNASPAKKKGEGNNPKPTKAENNVSSNTKPSKADGNNTSNPKSKAENNNSANPKPNKGNNNTSNSKPKGAKQQAPNGNKQRDGAEKKNAGNKKAKAPGAGGKSKPDAFKCQVCNHTASSKKALKQHLTTSHQYCTNCDKPFASPEALHQHNTTKHPRCPHCSKTFQTPQAVQQHIEAKHPNFECEVCNKSFASEDAWEQHKDSTEHWRCGACEKTFTLRAQLWQHQSDTGHGDDSDSDSDTASSQESDDESSSEEKKSPRSELLDMVKLKAKEYLTQVFSQ